MSESVSVVVTCHNLENYIGLAIESVINQGYRGPVEVAVIDDCSTDRSAEFIKSYANIRYLRPECNLGVLMATVLGLESTTGELVFFLDGDDVWERGKLTAIVERFRRDPRLALVTHDLEYIDSSGGVIEKESRPGHMMSSVLPNRESDVIRDGILLHSDYVWLGSAYAVRRRLGKVKEFCDFAKALPDPFNTYQDWPLAFWVACQPDVNLGYVPQKLFRYRLHGANHSGDATSVVKAVRNLRRTYNTTLAMSEIANLFAAETRVHEVTSRKLQFCTYLVYLYSNNKWQASKGFLDSMPYWMTGTSSFWKETVRFAGVQLLGAERFIGLARAGQKLALK